MLFQSTAASNSVGWLARGRIAIGELFFNEMMVWGDALLKDYGLENSIGIYPRVVIVLDIILKIIKNNELGKKKEHGED
ncbi:hypothetical protein [Clostridium tagluense]|uniref:hypothetical protein n=1 Tax=Clostridium tagluense TaxID=360422 RepID=UPI001CF34D58|nr:hypothetical protein [Clostridium tagluense]MCB2297940.1 hypothetical protein [Clostridium tagluense]